MSDRRFLNAPGVDFALTTARERMDMIAQARWALDLDWGEVVRIAHFFDACTVESGAIVFHEGDREAYLCLVVDGSVNVVKRSNRRARDKVLSTIGVGQTFGEMSLLDGAPRSATVVATENTQLLVLKKESFARLGEEAPRLVLRIVLRMTHMLSQRLRQTSGVLVEQLES